MAKAAKVALAVALLLLAVARVWEAERETVLRKQIWLNLINQRRLKRLTTHRAAFAVAGDPRDSQIALAKLLDAVGKDKDVDFLLMLGDITLSSKKEEYLLFFSKVMGLPKPVLVVPGNHDTRGPGFGWFRRLFGPASFVIRAGNATLVAYECFNKRRLFPPAKGWLKEALEKAKGSIIVLSHIPPYDPRKGNMAVGHSLKDPKESRWLIELFKRHKVKAMFFSHIHGFLKGKWQGIPFYITGEAGCEGMHRYPSYLRVKVTKGKIAVERVPVRLSRWEMLLDRIISRWAIPTWVKIDGSYLCIAVGLFILLLLF